MKQIQLLLIALACLCTLHLSIYSELLIVKQTPQGFVPLDQTDIDNSEQIAQILGTYQWPMCIMSDLSDKEQKALLAADTPNAEEGFIQNKIHEKLGVAGKDYHVIFIPTSIYELFCIWQILKEDRSNLTTDKFNPFQNAAYKTLLKVHEKKDGRIDITDIINEVGAPNVIRKKVFATYRPVNDVFFSGKENACIHINRALASELFERFPDLKGCADAQKLSTGIRNVATNYALSLAREIGKHASERNSWDLNKNPIYAAVIVPREIVRDMQDGITKMCISLANDESILPTIIALEYEARNLNKAILVRGSSPEDFQIGYHEEEKQVVPLRAPLIGSTLVKQESESDEGAFESTDLSFEAAYKGKKNQPYSISFGNSLFAGAMRDITACTYNFLTGTRVSGLQARPTKAVGYALLIDKEAYFINQCNRLFFISPLAPITALFQHGEYFHSRTTAAIVSKQKKRISILGLYAGGAEGIKDPSGLLLITRDPLNHAALFSRFIAENGRIIQRGASDLLHSEEKSIVDAQQKAARFYQAIKSLTPRIKKLTATKKATHPEPVEESKEPAAISPEQAQAALKQIETLIDAGNFTDVKRLIDNGTIEANATITIFDEVTPLILIVMRAKNDYPVSQDKIDLITTMVGKGTLDQATPELLAELLNLAIQSKTPNLVTLFFDHGADPKSNFQNQSLLGAAQKSVFFSKQKKIGEKEAQDVLNLFLYQAILRNDLELATQSMANARASADPVAVVNEHRLLSTALRYRSKGQQKAFNYTAKPPSNNDMVTLLMEKIFAKPQAGYTIDQWKHDLGVAIAQQRNPKIIEMLIISMKSADAAATFEIGNDIEKRNLFHEAIQKYKDVFTAKDTPAAIQRALDIIKMLVSNGATITDEDVALAQQAEGVEKSANQESLSAFLTTAKAAQKASAADVKKKEAATAQ